MRITAPTKTLASKNSKPKRNRRRNQMTQGNARRKMPQKKQTATLQLNLQNEEAKVIGKFIENRRLKNK
jgi:hypothetical protein